MAQRRMFSLKIIDTDLFLDMPMSARLLYYDLSMRADDDGFVASPKKIQRMIGCSDDDFKLLTAKQFIIPFENGVCVIKHWRIHNYIRQDRYSATIYQEEKQQLTEENGQYELDVIPTVNPKSYQRSTQVRLGKDRVELGKDNIEKKIKETDFDILISQYTEDENLKTNIYGFIKMRKGIKAPITTLGLKKILNKLDTLSNDNQEKIKILDNSIMNSWKGIYIEKVNNKHQNTKKTERSFNNFEGREYDYNSLEKKLLGWDKDEEVEGKDESNS